MTDEQLREAVAKSLSVMEVLRNIGVKEAGGAHSHYSSRIKKLELDTSHFLCGRVNGFLSRKSTEDILVLRESGGRTKSHQLIRALIDSGVPHECNQCGLGPSWQGTKLTLDVDHKNRNWLDDRLENIRFLCPNCHSQFTRGLFS